MSFILTFFQSDLVQQLAASAARSIFAAVGGILLAKGYITAGAMDQLVGLGMAGFAALWSLGAKLNAAK